MTFYKIFIPLYFSLCCFVHPVIAANKTANYWQCDHKVGGKWTFGQIPNACDIAPFADESQVRATYQPAIFDTKKNTETNRYMQVMYTVIRDISKYYIVKRQPNVSRAEVQAWQHAVFAIAHQESFWSHYRDTGDGYLKMVRGDYGHGHGLMQVDDRWHYLQVKNNGVGWDLVHNLLYALDIYYTGWQRAPSKNCVINNTDWQHRSQAAYSAYNGGMAKICRFTEPNNKWARNDKNFLNKYKNKSWESKVADKGKNSPINANCLAEGNQNCPNTSNLAQIAEKQLLQLEDGSACLLKGNKLHCIATIDDAPCLSIIDDFNPQSIQSVSLNIEKKYQRQTYDRHLCPLAIDNLYAVGTMISVHKSINIRATAGGNKIATTENNKTYQILDFILKDLDNLKRYYKIRHNNVEGYIYAGNNNDYQDWATPSSEKSTEQLIAQIGDWIEVTAPNGINLREQPNGTKVGIVEHATQAEVLDIQIKTANNRIYYQINLNGIIGYLYAGWLQPDNSLNKWAKLITEHPIAKRTGQGSSELWYVALKSCAADDCINTGGYLIGGALENACQYFGCTYKTDEVVELESNQNGWLRIKILRDNSIGWVKEMHIDWQ